mmetsp:Transcript_7022/g.21985  ORF Transcript_7022/g.21985 Transcript_7022/m.21985 type:complete len:239 (-) Transcript_7022:894-1610(-)
MRRGLQLDRRQLQRRRDVRGEGGVVHAHKRRVPMRMQNGLYRKPLRELRSRIQRTPELRRRLHQHRRQLQRARTDRCRHYRRLRLHMQTRLHRVALRPLPRRVRTLPNVRRQLQQPVCELRQQRRVCPQRERHRAVVPMRVQAGVRRTYLRPLPGRLQRLPELPRGMRRCGCQLQRQRGRRRTWTRVDVLVHVLPGLHRHALRPVQCPPRRVSNLWRQLQQRRGVVRPSWHLRREAIH